MHRRARAEPPAARSTGSAPPASSAAPSPVTLQVDVVAEGLDHPWDVKTLPGGTLIFTQRDRATLSVFKHGHVKKVKFPSDSDEGEPWDI